MRISDAGLDLIKEFEGCRLQAYPDPGTGGEPWTIGVGHTGGIHPGDACNQAQADEWLREDVAGSEIDVAQLVKVPLTQGQYDSLVSFVFNLGRGSLGTSTLLRLLNAGDTEGAAEQFSRWVNGPRGEMPGLVRRRQAEAALFRRVEA